MGWGIGEPGCASGTSNKRGVPMSLGSLKFSSCKVWNPGSASIINCLFNNPRVTGSSLGCTLDRVMMKVLIGLRGNTEVIVYKSDM